MKKQYIDETTLKIVENKLNIRLLFQEDNNPNVITNIKDLLISAHLENIN